MRIKEGGRAGALALLLVSDALAEGATRFRMRSAREVWRERRAASRALSLRRAGSRSAGPTARQLLRDRHGRSRKLVNDHSRMSRERQGATTRRWKELRAASRRAATRAEPGPSPLPTSLPPAPANTRRSLHPARPVTPPWIRWGMRGGRGGGLVRAARRYAPSPTERTSVRFLLPLLAAALLAVPAGAQPDPDDYRNFHTMAEMYLARGEVERAEAAQEEAVRRAREQVGEEDVLVVEQLAYLGEIQEARGEWGAAAENLGKAIRMSRRLKLLEGKGVGYGGKARAAKILRLHGHALEQLGKPALAVLSKKRAAELEKELDRMLKDKVFQGLDFGTPLKKPSERRPFFSHHVAQDEVSGFAPTP